MRRTLLVALVVGSLSVPAAALPLAGEALVFAGGGTPVTNGIFFPGTAFANGNEISGAPPVEVKRGSNFEFVNLDEAVVANGHKIQSFKRKRGRPLFQSELLTKPGQKSLVVTSHLKPGVYAYFCVNHSGMLGRIEIKG